MTAEELKEIFVLLAKQGLNPQLCDTPLPFYESPVMCGDPTMISDERGDDYMFPKELVSISPEFMCRAKGDSMCDAGIEEGDMLEVICDNVYLDGDIVIASIDGEVTVKVFCHDEKEQPWLLPKNKVYKPIKLKEKSNVRIIGKVNNIIHKAPRVGYNDCMKILREAEKEQGEKKVITPEHVSWCIREIAPEVKVARQWYAVYRAIVDKDVLKVEDFETFCSMVIKEVPEHEHLPIVLEMQRLAVLSFRKPIKKWDPSDAPVKGERFKAYKSIGLKMISLLEG